MNMNINNHVENRCLKVNSHATDADLQQQTLCCAIVRTLQMLCLSCEGNGGLDQNPRFHKKKSVYKNKAVSVSGWFKGHTLSLFVIVACNHSTLFMQYILFTL